MRVVASAGTAPAAPRPEVRNSRRAWADNLKVVLVAGVIVAHVTMAWTGVGNWVFTETPVREPLWSLLVLLSGVAALFGMPLFFALAGLFTPPALARKGTAGFLRGRALRLGVPLLVYLLAFAPFIEYVDPDNAGWADGLWSFAVSEVWWTLPMPPTWGPAWFLAVLLVFSIGYAGVRSVRPAGSGTLTGRGLVLAGLLLAAASFAVRTFVPLGTEVFRLALGQAPAWVVGFALGVLGAERGWLEPVDPLLSRRARRTALVAAGAFALVVAVGAATGMDIDAFSGGATWQSALVCAIEAALVLAAPLWLIDVFQRRFDHQGPLLRTLARAAFAAFLIHQGVLVVLVLVSQGLGMPPEADFFAVAGLGVAISFGIGALLVRIPGVSRIV